MEFLPIFFIVGIAIFVLGIWVISHQMEKKRAEAFELAAGEMGLSFSADGDTTFSGQMDQFGLFNKGHSKKLTNLIQAETEDVRISIFDYKYTTGSGKHQATHKQTIACLESQLLDIPEFKLRPEGMFDKIGSALGFQDIDFDTHPDFSNMYVLQGPNEERIRKFFNGEMLSYFESLRGMCVEAKSHGSLIFFRAGKRRKPEEIRTKLEEAYRIFSLMTDAAPAKG